MKKDEIALGSVQKTLLLPLWGRAAETRKNRPLLMDNTAVRIIDAINYDFTTIKNTVNPLIRTAWIARSIYFDDRIRAFLEKHPSGTIVNIGCGLDTTYDRIDNGTARWYELDFPDVIELRKQYIRPGDRRIFLAGSVLDDAWYDMISEKSNVLLLFAGVIYYFAEDTVKSLFNTFGEKFGKCDILFDYASVKGMNMSNKRLLEKSGMDSEARLRWGIDDIFEIEKWDKAIKVLESIPMYSEHKKKYPLFRRIGMTISDRMKVMSLAHVEINRAGNI